MAACQALGKTPESPDAVVVQPGSARHRRARKLRQAARATLAVVRARDILQHHHGGGMGKGSGERKTVNIDGTWACCATAQCGFKRNYASRRTCYLCGRDPAGRLPAGGETTRRVPAEKGQVDGNKDALATLDKLAKTFAGDSEAEDFIKKKKAALEETSKSKTNHAQSVAKIQARIGTQETRIRDSDKKLQDAIDNVAKLVKALKQQEEQLESLKSDLKTAWATGTAAAGAATTAPGDDSVAVLKNALAPLLQASAVQPEVQSATELLLAKVAELAKEAKMDPPTEKAAQGAAPSAAARGASDSSGKGAGARGTAAADEEMSDPFSNFEGISTEEVADLFERRGTMDKRDFVDMLSGFAQREAKKQRI